MGRDLKRLSAVGAERKRKPGRYADGDGLYLQVSPTGAKSWIFRYSLQNITISSQGKRLSREMGLGPYPVTTLTEARKEALEARKLLLERIDPIEARIGQRVQDALLRANSISFRDCATRFIAAHRAKWANAKHVDQWTNTLETYCGPVFGDLPVSAVNDGLVIRVLEPIWESKNETATRLRQRIEAVLDWARVRGFRAGDNPARLKGHLDMVLPNFKKKDRVKHHAALPYSQIGEFVALVRKQEGIAAKALEFTILTAARTGEVIGATPSEFDLDAGLWTIPASRMKARRAHRVPLSPQATSIIRSLLEQGGEFVFPGMKAGTALSNMAMLAVLKRMGRTEITTHGFRSAFRDWASEQTNYPREVAEMALAHTIGDKTEAAYRRGDLVEKRKLMMLDWAKHCDRVEEAKVISIKKRPARRTP
jgi:integrase